MAPRARVTLLVAAAAAAAAGATVGITLATSNGVPKPKRAAVRPGAPPLVLDLGLRTDPEAVALRRATRLYDRGRRKWAAPIFAGYTSVEAQVGAALAGWPGRLKKIVALARVNPHSGIAQLELGLAYYWLRDLPKARAAWRRAKQVAPDSLYGIRAGDLLHPDLPVPGLPQFVPGVSPPAALLKLSPAQQLARLRLAARTQGACAKILYGVALQRLDRPLSAEREFAAAARSGRCDPEAKVAAAVGLFDKDDPARAFARLGPLARVFPRSVSVRFHLGLLLLWLGQIEQAKKQLSLAHADAPSAPLGRQAKRLLLRLQNIRTK